MLSDRYWVALAASLLVGVSHAFLKAGSRSADGGSFASQWLNRWSLSGYTGLFMATLMNLWAFKVVPLRANVVLAPIALLTAICLSLRFFSERLTRTQIIGTLLIIAGLVSYNI